MQSTATAKYLNRQQAAAYVQALGIPCAVSTLEAYACRGGGPQFRKFGRKPLYTELDLDAWIASRISAPRVNNYTVR